jgi:hypothetical protein
MQNYCKTIGALAAASALVAGNASAEVEYELHTGYTSEYLFRGANLGQDLIEVGADVAGEWNGIGLSAGAWYGSFKKSGQVDVFNNTADYTADTWELDLYAEVSKDFGFVTGAIGYIIYINSDSESLEVFNQNFNPNSQDYQEVYFSIARDWGFVDSSFTYFWGIEGENFGYSELAFSRSFELNPCLALNLDTNVSYLFDESEFGSWTTSATLDWGFAGTAKLSPFVALSVAIADELDDELVGGAMLSVGF